MAGNIIPAIATANAMTASLCVLQSFHVLRNSLPTARMVYLSKSNPYSTTASGKLWAPNPQCPTCSVAMGHVYIDRKATVDDFVKEIVKQNLGYDDDFSIMTAAGVVYDPDMEDNLEKRLTEVGIIGDTFISIRDEGDDNPRVQLDLYVSEESVADDAKPVRLAENIDVPRRPKAEFAIRELNGNGSLNGSTLKRKRDDEADADTDSIKKAKMQENNSKDTPFVVDDDDAAAINLD